MDMDDIRSLFAYNEWANGRLFSSLSALSDEQLTRNLDSSFPSIRDTVAHFVFAEWAWLRRWKGENPSGPPPRHADAGLDHLRETFEELHAERSAFLENLSGEEQLGEVVVYRNIKGEEQRRRLGDLCRHVVNHSSYHRGQVATLLRQVGGTPAATDFVLYKESH